MEKSDVKKEKKNVFVKLKEKNFNLWVLFLLLIYIVIISAVESLI